MWEQNQPIALISIHAPTRGATNYLVGVFMQLQISIHAPTRGATVRTIQKTQLLLFQSTLLQEERLTGKPWN